MSEMFPSFKIISSSNKTAKHVFINQKNQLLFNTKDEAFIFSEDLDIKNGYEIFSNDKDSIVLHFCSFDAPLDMIYLSQKEVFMHLDNNLLNIYSRAYQMSKWINHFNFCPQHGCRLSTIKHDLAKACEQCKHDHYPKMSPCILVVVKNENDILLVKHNNGSNFFTAIAGFVEYGESIEETVKREVFEEVGLKVTQLEYFNSQSWPFPNQLMMAFTALSDNRELMLDQEEIQEAGWFSKTQLPLIPPELSLSGKLIKKALNS